MGPGIKSQIDELQQTYKGLATIVEKENEVVVSGMLFGVASCGELESITLRFNIELIVPANYPDDLPYVRETSNKIDDNYGHINSDGSLCLAVPVVERNKYLEQPSLLGFVNNLLVPYLYSYVYWKKNQVHPFGEYDHGGLGVIQYYGDKFQITDALTVLSIICYLYEYGYRGHHPCPCGSGEKVRKCHGKMLCCLNEIHSKCSIKNEFISVISCFDKLLDTEKTEVPEQLRRQVSRLLEKIGNSNTISQ